MHVCICARRQVNTSVLETKSAFQVLRRLWQPQRHLQLDENRLEWEVRSNKRGVIGRRVRQHAVQRLDAVTLHQVRREVEQFVTHQLLAHTATST